MNSETQPEAVPATPASAAVTARKDSTAEVPMFDLGEIVDFVNKIRENALEAASMPEVAKGMGYAHPSSTPFYRRMVSGRLFGLLSSSKAELTHRARDYFQPDTDGASQRALVDAIMGIPIYAELVQRHSGKKLNTDLVRNGLAKTLSLTDGCANTCAAAFAASLKFAGFLLADGTVAAPNAEGLVPSRQPTAAKAEAVPEPDSEVQTQTLFLDRQKLRKFTVVAPLTVSQQEYQRICRWLEVTLIVEDQPQATKKPSDGGPSDG